MSNVWRTFTANRPMVQPTAGVAEIEDVSKSM